MKRISNLSHALMLKKNHPLLLLEGLTMLLKFGNVNELLFFGFKIKKIIIQFFFYLILID